MQTVSRLLLPLFLLTAVATHLVMSFAQTLMHYKLGHHPMGGKFFRNHINFHHNFYSKDHLVSQTYLGDEGNNTPFFFIPVFLVGACTYLLLPIDLFVVQVAACAASFYAHVFFDKEYHMEGSRLQRFAWFRRKQELHFVHHRHANSNFAVIHFFWDRILGTYRRPDAGQTQANGIREHVRKGESAMAMFNGPGRNRNIMITVAVVVIPLRGGLFVRNNLRKAHEFSRGAASVGGLAYRHIRYFIPPLIGHRDRKTLIAPVFPKLAVILAA